MKGGAIIVGSLLWDTTPERKRWREDDLCFEESFQVYLPIRYGRRYATRKNTYTMVFSNMCSSGRYGLGSGWILPIRTEINSFEDLKEEAQNMGKVEGIGSGLSKNWGSVALLLNPNKEIDDVIRIEWKKLMTRGLIDHPLFTEKLKSEKAPIDSNEFLTIKWPKELSRKNKIDKLDFLIATAIVPTLVKGRYPTPHQIVDAMQNARCYKYYKRNREHEITNFQDERISKLINRTDFMRKD